MYVFIIMYQTLQCICVHIYGHVHICHVYINVTCVSSIIMHITLMSFIVKLFITTDAGCAVQV